MFIKSLLEKAIAPMPPDLVVPPAIEEQVQAFDRATSPFSEHDVEQALGKARRTLQDATESEKLGAWAEVLAFALDESRMHHSPWGTYFGPRGSGTDKDGKTHYFPDIAGTDPQVIAHWSTRAKALKNPVLKARYADLAWDMSPVIAKARRDPEMARLAIDAYLASVPASVRSELHDRFEAALRALDLSIMVRDPERTERARAALLQLHREVMATHDPQWWVAYDRLIEEKNAGVTEAERQQFVTDLEELVVRYSGIEKSETFDPHAVEAAAQRLIRYYTRLQQPDDVKRLHIAVAQAFERFAALSGPMLASAVLQTSVNAYRDAGLADESKRVRILMEEKIGQARQEMKAVQTEFKVSHDDMETFLEAVVVDDLAATFARIALQFLPNRRDIEEQVRKSAEHAPLMALIPQKIMADDHVVAKIGSVEDDPFGRLLQQTTMNFGISAIWLQAALYRAIEKHKLNFEHFASWANRLELFDDLTFLLEGVRAWFEGDLVKALHVLVPQMEAGLRSIVAKLGKPITKAHTTIADVSVAIGMGDILYSDELAGALGPDLTLYFLALYADPRGKNLRNRIAHGLIKPQFIGPDLVHLLIHSMLVLGMWKK